MKPAARRARKRVKASMPIKPYLKTIEVKGLYRPAREAKISAEAPASAAANSGLSLAGSFGGIEGIIAMMGKAQQMFRLFQQMAPMFKMLDSLGGAKALTASLSKSRSHMYRVHRKVNTRKRVIAKK